MCVHVNSLPDDCLLPIFDRIPLSDLFQLDQICPRWASLFPSACARRHTLVLIGGGVPLHDVDFRIPFNSSLEMTFDGGKLYYDLPVLEREASFTLPENKVNTLSDSADDEDKSENSLDIDPTSMNSISEAEFTELARFHSIPIAYYSAQMVTYFSNLFPNVDKLVVINNACDEKELNSLVELLRSTWSLRIVKLWLRTREIDYAYADRLEHHPVLTLLSSINQQSTLQQLTLDIDVYGLFRFTFPVESYSFIAQLKVAKLYLGDYDAGNLIWDIVHRFNSTNLHHIDMGNFYNHPVNTGLNAKYEFTAKVNQLYWDWTFETAEQFNEFCWRYCSLTVLQMHWTQNITFTRLVSNLASLGQLIHLKLYLKLMQHPENPFVLVDQVGEEERFLLQQVKILELDIEKRSHHDFDSLSPMVFPSVKVIILWDYSFMESGSECTTCLPFIKDKFDYKVTKRCHRLFILSLKNKFKLARLYVADGNYYGPEYADWTNYERAEEDNLPEIGDGDDDQPDEVGE